MHEYKLPGPHPNFSIIVTSFIKHFEVFKISLLELYPLILMGQKKTYATKALELRA